MKFSSKLTEEERECVEVATRFARERLAPKYLESENSGVIDRRLLKEMGRLGLIGSDLAVEHGGAGLSSFVTGALIETIGYADINVAYVPLLASLLGDVLARHAAPDVARHWLPKTVSGEAILALGLTEPRGGSDAASLTTTARAHGNGFRINGEKTSISMAAQADAVVLFARTGAFEDGARGVSGFLVPLDSPGISRTAFNDVGARSAGRGSIFFDDVFVPADHLLGDEGRGFVQVMQGFDYSRALIGLQCVGAAQASLDETWAYVQEREAFGAPIGRYQGVTFPLAEAETMIEATRQLCLHTLKLRDNGMPHTREAAMCKWMGPKVAHDAIHQCLLTFGHYGYSMETAHQQRMRDVMGFEIGDGTAQIMKLIIARTKIGNIAAQHQPLNGHRS